MLLLEGKDEDDSTLNAPRRAAWRSQGVLEIWYFSSFFDRQEVLGWAVVLVVIAKVSFFLLPSPHANEHDKTSMKRVITCDIFLPRINNLKRKHSLMGRSVIAFANGAPISEHLLSAV